jgi:phage baseplate assembly protein W
MNDSGFLGRGWAFPPAFDKATGTLQLSAGVANIQQSIDLVLKTPKGSRPLTPDFGSSLGRYLFRRIDATLREEIVQAVQSALLEGEPRIDVERVDVALAADGALADISVTYRVRSTNTRHNHVYPYARLEGHLLRTAP